MMQVNDEYAAVKDMPVASMKEAGGAKPGDNGLQGLRVPAPQQPTTNSGNTDHFRFSEILFVFYALRDCISSGDGYEVAKFDACDSVVIWFLLYSNQ